MKIAQGIDQIEFNLKQEAQDVIPYADRVTDEGGASQGFISILMNFLQVIMFVGVLAMLLYLIWGAFEWITSGGDSGKTEKARNKITQAIIGVLVLSATVAIFRAIQDFLGIEAIHFID